MQTDIDSENGGYTNLRIRTVYGARWQFTSVVAQAILQLAVLAVLSRLLSPSDFGTLGVAMIFVGFGNLLIDMGVGPALVQRQNLNQHHIRVGFVLSILGGATLTSLTWLAAPSFANLVNNLEVQFVLRLLCFNFLLASIGLVANALLWRRMDFKAKAIAEIASYVGGYGIIGTWLAVRGMGLYSLVWAVLVNHAIRSALFLLFAPHSLRPSFRPTEAFHLIRFGAGLSLTRFFNYVATRGDYLIVSRWLGATALGFYERAYRLIEIPSNYFAGVISKVAFPAMSEIQGDQVRLGRTYFRAVELVAIIYIPVSVFLEMTSQEFVMILFGRAWMGVVSTLQIMSVGLLFRASYKINDTLVIAIGAVYQSAWRMFVYALAVVVGAFAGLRWGIDGVAVGIVTAIFLKYILMAQLCLYSLRLSWRDYLYRHLVGIVLGGVVFMCVVVSKIAARFLGSGNLGTFLICIAITAVLSVAAIYLLPVRLFGPDFHWYLMLLEEYLPFRCSFLTRVVRRFESRA